MSVVHSIRSQPRIDIVRYEFLCNDVAVSFHVVRFSLEETMSAPYALTLELATDDTDCDAVRLLGRSAELVIRRGDQERSIHGIVASLEHRGVRSERLVVTVEIVPAFALLEQDVRSRIFQDQSVQDVVGTVLREGLQPYDRTFDLSALRRGTAPRDYCVQYGESTFRFVARLLAEEGISFHFRHDAALGHEVLVLTDDNKQFARIENIDGSEIVPIIHVQPELAERESLHGFDVRERLRPTASDRQDFDFLAPRQPLTEAVGGAGPDGRTRRLYRHMNRRFVTDDVKARATDTLEHARVDELVGQGIGNVTGCFAGGVFELDRHERPDLEQAYLITAVKHEGHCPEALFQGDLDPDAHGPRYVNRIQCIPLSRPLRPAPVPRPRVHGPQTAIVVGPSGETIHTDPHGRIKLQFHWEENPANDDESSCWVRLAQSWAGPGWGVQFIPRVGMEAVVHFLGGNPDRPIVTGCVYNGDNAPPFSLPDNKTQSGFLTDGNNELRFEDAGGIEEIYLHAQRDWNTVVEHNRTLDIGNDETHHVGHDRTQTTDHDETEEIGANRTISVGADHRESIGGNRTLSVDKDETTTITGNDSLSVGKDRSETVGGSSSTSIGRTSSLNVALASDEMVGAAKTVEVGGLYAETVGAARSMTVVGPFSLSASSGSMSVAKAFSVSAGAAVSIAAKADLVVSSDKKTTHTSKNDLSIHGDAKGVLEFKEQLTIKCGQASITLRKNGDITIKGKKITLDGSGDVKVKGSKIANN